MPEAFSFVKSIALQTMCKDIYIYAEPSTEDVETSRQRRSAKSKVSHNISTGVESKRNEPIHATRLSKAFYAEQRVRQDKTVPCQERR